MLIDRSISQQREIYLDIAKLQESYSLDHLGEAGCAGARRRVKQPVTRQDIRMRFHGRNAIYSIWN